MNRIIAFYSFVFINKVDDEILMFNTINKSTLVVGSKTIYDLFANMESNDISKYCIEFNEELFEDNIFNSFLIELEEKSMGELLPQNINCMPILFPPLLSIGKNDYDVICELINSNIDDERFSKERNNLLGCKILNNLKEISVYTNSASSQYCEYRNCNKFYSFPIIGGNEYINFSSLLKFIDYNYQYRVRVNFVIGDLSEDLIVNINKFVLYSNNKFDIFVFTMYSNINSINRLNVSPEKIILWVLPFNDLVENSNYKLIGLFSSDSELDYYEKKDFLFFYYYPYFTGDNAKYCFDKLKYALKDIMEQNLGEADIFSHKLINSNFFGRISILPNGELFTCINKNSLGNINSDNLKDLLLKEMTEAQNWFLTRSKISPCSNCKYNILCPPISDFELYMNQFNFCDFR